MPEVEPVTSATRSEILLNVVGTTSSARRRTWAAHTVSTLVVHSMEQGGHGVLELSGVLDHSLFQDIDSFAALSWGRPPFADRHTPMRKTWP
jgi:hypothetical protein